MTIDRASIVQKQYQLSVSGELNFKTVMGVWRDSQAFLISSPELIFDLAGVTASNSAGLALLLEWLRYAKRENKKISFLNVPSQLLLIAAVADVKELLIT